MHLNALTNLIKRAEDGEAGSADIEDAVSSTAAAAKTALKQTAQSVLTARWLRRW